MALRAIMAAIKALEETVSITDPLTVSLAANNLVVYRVSPSRSVQVSALATFMNWPDAAVEARMGGSREDAYTVQVDCLVNVADADKAADIALALFDRTWQLFDEQREAGKRLSNTVDYLTLRAERPMVETIDWGGKGFAGFHIFLDIVDFEESL